MNKKRTINKLKCKKEIGYIHFFLILFEVFKNINLRNNTANEFNWQRYANRGLI